MCFLRQSSNEMAQNLCNWWLHLIFSRKKLDILHLMLDNSTWNLFVAFGIVLMRQKTLIFVFYHLSRFQSILNNTFWKYCICLVFNNRLNLNFTTSSIKHKKQYCMTSITLQPWYDIIHLYILELIHEGTIFFVQ